MMRSGAVLSALVLLVASACVHTPTDEEVHISNSRRALGVELMTQNRYREALGELLEAEKLNPGDPELQYTLGLVYFNGFQRHDDARQHLSLAMKAKKDYSEAENLYGVTLMEQERCAEAIPYFERAAANLLYATPEFALQNQGWCLYKTGKVEEGLRLLEHAVARAPHLCGAYYWLGQAYAEQGQTDTSIRWFTAFREKCDGTDLSRFIGAERIADVLYRLGMAHQKQGDTASAREALESCCTRFEKTSVAVECRKSLDVLP
ncbi:MAG: tetratricopeptide repeat protein [Pseudomonadota bacterium]